MKHTVPHTPFSMRLSGSAKETELRLRSIFQWKKKRPPVLLMLLTAFAVLSCFGLVSCQIEPPAADDPALDSVVETTPPTEDPVRETPIVTDENDPAAVLTAMSSVQAADFTNPEYFGCVTAEALAAALNAAVSNQISEAEFLEAVDGEYGQVFPHWYIEDAWLEGGSGGHPGTDRHLSIQCGLPEHIVEVSLSEDNHRSIAYFNDEVLYWLIREKDAYEEYMTSRDPIAYDRFEDLLIDQMERTLAQHASNPGNFYGYELKRFTLAFDYEDTRDGGLVEVYHFSFGLLTETPETVGWAGGMALDHKLRVIHVGEPTYLAVKYRNKQVAATAFLGGDYDLDRTSEQSIQLINTALDNSMAAFTDSLQEQHAALLYVDREVSFDLNGDGVMERILVSVRPTEYDYAHSLFINGIDYTDTLSQLGIYSENPDLFLFAITDLDTGDGLLEIALPDDGPSNDPNTTFLRWDGSSLSCLGEAYGKISDGDLALDGGGLIHGTMRLSVLQTWFAPATWQLGTDGRLEVAPQELYLQQWEQTVTALEELAVYATNDAGSTRTALPAGTQFSLLGTDNVQWVLCADANGDRFWLRLEEASAHRVELFDGSWSWSALSGLTMAD